MGQRTFLGLKKNRIEYDADGVALVGKNLTPILEPGFAAAWRKAADAYIRATGKPEVDLRLRANIALNAARQALLAEGDFVEFGVATGMLSTTICHALDFAKINRAFWLFDTYEGVPLHALQGDERTFAEGYNAKYYSDVYAQTKEAFSTFPNAKLVRGCLPDTLSEIPSDRKIAYLSIDLNSKTYEMQVIEKLWLRISIGGMIVLDDYAFKGHDEQFNAWNNFATSVGHPIFFVPTGQGLIFKAA